MKATEHKKLEIAKDIARKLEEQLNNDPKLTPQIYVNKGTLKELCRMIRRMKIEKVDNP